MRRAFLLIAALGLIAASCGGSGEDISVDGVWARNSPMSSDRGAVYMNLESADGDRLLSASVNASIAGTVEVHETVPAEGGDSEAGMGEDEDMGDAEGMGMMMMQEVEAIDLPAGETVSLEPGGYHIMLIDLAEPLEIGEKFDLTLNFESYGEKVLEVEVMEAAP